MASSLAAGTSTGSGSPRCDFVAWARSAVAPVSARDWPSTGDLVNTTARTITHSNSRLVLRTAIAWSLPARLRIPIRCGGWDDRRRLGAERWEADRWKE